MNRSTFKRKVLERKRSVPVAMRGRTGVMASVGDEAAPQPKHARVIDDGYRRWVASLPCIRCHVRGFSQAAHPNQGRGLGQKSDDTLCFPLCCSRPGVLGCHAAFDQLHGIKLSERRRLEIQYSDDTQKRHFALLGMKS